MFLLFWKLISWLFVFMSFSNSNVINEEAFVNPYYNDFLFDDDIVNYINGKLLLDQITPVINYNMGRYVDESFKLMCVFFKYDYIDYDRFLHDYVIKLGQYRLAHYSEENAHLMVFVSTLKKMYVLDNMTLDSLDYYIIDWAKKNLSLTEMVTYRDAVLEKPYLIKVIVYRPDIDVIDIIK